MVIPEKEPLGKKILFFPEEVTINDPLYEPLKLLNFPTCRHLSWLKIFSHKSIGISPSLLYDVEKMKKVAEIVLENYKLDNDGVQCRAKILFEFYYPYIRSLFKFYFFSIEKVECKMTEPRKGAEKQKTYEGFLALNKDFRVFKLLRHLILSIYDEMSNEYLALLHGEIISIKGTQDNNPKLSDTIFHDAIKHAITRADTDDPITEISLVISDKDLIQRLLNVTETELNPSGKVSLWTPYLVARLLTWIGKPFEEQEDILRVIINDREIISPDPTQIKDNPNPIICKEACLKFLSENVDVGKISYCNGFLFEYSLKSDSMRKNLIYHNYSQISDYFQFESQIQVECPCCKTICILSEHSKTIELQNALLRTFEMRRSKWLLMSGSLHLFFRGATHTRLSHQVGTLIVALNTFNLMNVNITKETIIPFGNYLYLTDSTYEFLLSQVLHDIGHAPMSHVLEKNPFLEYDHEVVTANLISGKKDSGKDDWYKSQYHYLKLRYIHEYSDLYEKMLDEDLKKKYPLKKYLAEIDLVISSEIVVVNHVLENFGISPNKIIDILKDIPKKEVRSTEQKPEKYFDIFHSLNSRDLIVLHAFLHSAVDLDRIDHVKRDSTMSGVSLFNAKLDDLLGSMSIILPEGSLHKHILLPEGVEKDYPVIMISENGIKYFLDLLNTRKTIFREVLFSDQNNWINGILNQMTAYAIRYQPHLPQLLPFITDQVIFHLYNHKQLNLVEFKKYNRLVQGRKGYDLYGEPVRYKFIGKSLSRKVMKKIYSLVEDINRDQTNFVQFPTVILYTNISIADDIDDNIKNNFCPLKQTTWDNIFIYGKMLDDHYHSFKDLTENSNNPRFKDFWQRPDENDVKNLLYIWVNSLVTFGDCNTGCESGKAVPTEKDKIIEDLMKDITKEIFESLEGIEKSVYQALYLNGDWTFFNKIYSTNSMVISPVVNKEALRKIFEGDKPSENGGITL